MCITSELFWCLFCEEELLSYLPADTTIPQNAEASWELPQTISYTEADTVQYSIWVCCLGTHRQHSCGCFFQQTVSSGTAVCWYSCSAEGMQAPWSLCTLFHDKCVHFRGPKPGFHLPAYFRTYQWVTFLGHTLFAAVMVLPDGLLVSGPTLCFV